MKPDRHQGILRSARRFATRRFKKKNPVVRASMHFSAYLMIAALILLGLQLAYAFYQLASFVL